MRADRLISLVLLLRQRGRMSAAQLADELEVSTRTVLRDIEALSTAGVPVYAERGRHGGFALLPGFRTELTGLNHDEALALLAASSTHGEQVFGLGPALASAMRKVLDALPESNRTTAHEAAQRILVDPEIDLLSRRRRSESVPDAVMNQVRRAVLGGHRLRIHYAAPDRPPTWRTVDPIGLVIVRETGYLLATAEGTDRTYRLARITAAELLPEPAQRPAEVDLRHLWQERSIRFRTGGDRLSTLLRIDPTRREELADTALAIAAVEPEADGRLRLEASFQDLRHATWALWQLGTDAEALSPSSLRTALRERAAAVAAGYTDPIPGTGSSGQGRSVEGMEITRMVPVLDAADIEAVSTFWAGLLGGRVAKDDGWHSVLVDEVPRLDVQLAPGHVPPQWPDGQPQQIHLDISVTDIAAAHERALAIGAVPLTDPDRTAAEGFAVYADPAGHPFCLCWG